MASLVDIPTYLLNADNKDSFIAWLKALPVETWIRRDLARAWQKYTTVKFTDQDYIQSGL